MCGCVLRACPILLIMCVFWKVTLNLNKKIISFITAGMIAASSVFAAGCKKQTPEGANYSFDCALPGNPESLDPQTASDVNSMTVIGNLFTGLMKTDETGKLEKAAAKDYTISEDGLRYTFTLRNDCYWFFDSNEDEEADENELTQVTAYDFEFAFKRIFNPETHSPHMEKFLCLKNAEAIIKGDANYTDLGVSAISDTELSFELEYPSAGFLNTLTFTAAMPCNEQFFNNTKGRYGLDDRSVASNGAFFIRQWFYDPYGSDNFIYMRRNSKNDGFDRIYPSFLNFYIKDSAEEAAQSFDEGTSDVLLSFVYDKKKYGGNVVNSYFNYTLGIIINPEKKQYSNQNIRKALAYGIDKEAFAEQLPDDMLAAYGIIPPGISFLNKSYREINADKTAAISAENNGQYIEYNADKALQYYQDGMKEMDLKSLENIKILVPKDYMDTEYLHLVTQNWQTLFGFYIGIEEVVSEEFYQRISDGDYTMALYPMTGSFNDPVSILEEFEKSNNQFGYNSSDFQSIVDEIKKLGNYNEGVELYNKAENTILNDFSFIPVFYKKQFQILGSGNHDIIYDPFTKQLNFRYAKYYE